MTFIDPSDRDGNDLVALDLVLTTACNQSCAYCYQNAKRAGRMSWGTLRGAVDLLLRSRRREVTLSFYGGEPLLELDRMRRAVEYAESRRSSGTKLRYAVSTNGTLLDDDTVDFLAAHRFDTQISFDGLPAAQDRRAPGSFRLLDERLDRIRARHPVFFAEDVEVGLTLTGATLSLLADSVEYFLAKGGARVKVAPCLTHDPDWHADRIGELDRQISRIFRACRRQYLRAGEVSFSLFRHTGTAEKRPAPDGLPVCVAATGQSPTVDVRGELRGCVLASECYQRFPSAFLREKLAPLQLGHVSEPLSAGRLAAYRAAARASGLFHDKAAKWSSYGRCRDCRHLDDCFICPISIGHIQGNTDPTRVPDFQCAFNLVVLDHRARFPRQPTIVERLAGLAPLPQLVRELESFSTYHERDRGRTSRAGEPGRPARRVPGQERDR